VSTDVECDDHTSPVTTTTTHSASSPPEVLSLPSDQMQSQKGFDFDFHFDATASYEEILGPRMVTGGGFDMDLEFLSSLQA